jgi:hypothetical protein
MRTEPRTPDWYDESKLRQVEYAPNYRGWIIDLGDGTCRYANDPMLGEGNYLLPNYKELNAKRPHYGDRVRLVDDKPDKAQIIERWMPELYDEDGDLKGSKPDRSKRPEGIVGFGQSVFYPYEAKIYGLEAVRRKIEARKNLSSPDWAVLGCYCEDDMEATLMLHELEQTREAQSHLDREGLISFKMDAMMLMTHVEQMTDLDRHFKVHRFAPMVINTWKQVLAAHWEPLIKAAKQSLDKLAFHAPVYQRIISQEEPAKAEATYLRAKWEFYHG